MVTAARGQLAAAITIRNVRDAGLPIRVGSKKPTKRDIMVAQ